MSEQVKPVVCSVARSGPKPILFLPKTGGSYGAPLPKGEVEMRLGDVSGERVLASVAKIAINVCRRETGSPNCLPAILFGWFGDDAGAAGTPKHRVAITRVGAQWVMAPVRQCEVSAAA